MTNDSCRARAARATRWVHAVVTAAVLTGCARSSTPPRDASSREPDGTVVGHAELLTANLSAPPGATETSQASATTSPASSTTAPQRADGESASSGGHRPGRTLGFVLLGLGATAGVVAIGTSALMLHNDAARADNCNAQKICTADGMTANGQLHSLGPWNVGAWIVAVAGAGVGAFLVLTNPSSDSKRTAVGVTPNGAGMNLSVRSTF